MTKDPAVLFYTSDFIAGTLTMTDEQRGQYIVLLCLQHQKGALTEKDMLKICGSYDEDIWSKFQQSNGKFYNTRMKEEAEKRRRYAESRANNRRGKFKEVKEGDNISKTYEKHMVNENENVNTITNKGNKKAKPPKHIDEVYAYFNKWGYKREAAKKFFHSYNENGWHDSNGKPILAWKQKAQQVWFRDEHKITDAEIVTPDLQLKAPHKL